jgi:chaperone modulatory protein CbpM
MAPESTVLVGHIVEEGEGLSLDQLCEVCAVGRHEMLQLIAEGVLEEQPTTVSRFSGTSLRRARLAIRLQRDLGVNVAGVALVIDLLERIAILEHRISR